MRRATVEEVKKIQIELLDLVADFCEKNEIAYWIDCGTLLGAIRHKGYIPWDDDIDVGMLRVDFERFSELFNNRNDQYYFICAENTPDAYYAHGKVLDRTTTLYEPDEKGYKTCINIDIFVYDNVPNEEIAKKMYDRRDKCRFFHGTRFAHGRPSGNALRRTMVYIFRYMLKLVPKGFFIQKMARNAKQYKKQETKYVGNFTSYARMICEKEVFDSFTTAEFEGKEYRIPIGYDRWLRAFYGDYMQLPPEEKRVSHHKFEAYVND